MAPVLCGNPYVLWKVRLRTSFGERFEVVRDPFRHRRLISHHAENISPEGMQHRYTAMPDEDSESTN